jgi:uncharacterized protein
MYLERHLESILRESVREFPVIALMGPRQVGKTTLLRELFGGEYEYVTLDELSARTQAQRDPALFMRNHPGRLILDEIQYTPALLSEIKIEVDARKEPGRYILTGSQQFQVMRNLRETLAGRILLLNLHPMTIQEVTGQGRHAHWLSGLLDHRELDRSLLRPVSKGMSPAAALARGGLPGLLTKTEKFHPAFFESYLKTYIERDLPHQFDVKDAGGIVRFLSLLAPQTSCEINKSHLGRELSVSPPTANRWLGWLGDSLIWREHPPYHGNLIKRVSKHPKGFLFDTGFCAHLLRVHGAQPLSAHPLVGRLFETAVRIELESVIEAALLPARCYHWRTPHGTEVDVVIEHDGKLFAFECKWSTIVNADDLKGLRRFKELYGDAVVFRGVIVPSGRAMLLEDDIMQIPWLPGD